MSATPSQRRMAAMATALTMVAGTVTFVAVSTGSTTGADAKAAAGHFPWKAREFQGGVQGEFGVLDQEKRNGEAHQEALEAGVAASQFDAARKAPGWVQPGAYSAAFSQWSGLSTTAGSWSEVTNTKYHSDDVRYKDYYSNSGAGSSYVSGRVPAIAVDPGSKAVFAAGAVGGVMKSASGTGGWVPWSDGLPASASGDIEVIDGKVWYATGDAATGSTTYVGNGVYATSPAEKFTPDSKVGGSELDGATILSIAKSKGTGPGTADDRIYIAGSYGIWSHAATWNNADERTAPWRLEFAPHEEYLPGGAKQFDPVSPYKNIAYDVIEDPEQPGHLLAAMGWVAGEDYNGWYEAKPGGTFQRIRPQGAVSDLSIGKTTFEYSADGSKLYAVVQTPIIKGSFFYYSELQGVFASKSGSLTGPWSKIADAQKLQNSGSALRPQIPKYGLYFTGYQPGVQAWFNQFLGVDPEDPDHVFLGLEEIYETFDGGATWRTTGPYWNFYFTCWTPGNTDPQNGCPKTTHSDQHDVAFGEVDGEPTAFFGNDGGVYAWPMETGKVDAAGHGTSWRTLSEDGSLRQTQYYAMDAGLQGDASKAALYERLAPGNNGLIVSGGLQDNGGSILFEGESVMGSNFGGDGGDVLVDPMDGCNIVQEYTNLAMRVTNECAAPTHPNASVDPSKSVTRSIAPPDTAARFIAPFAADAKDITSWIAGGRRVWHNSEGFGIDSGADWALMKDLGAGNLATAVAADGDQAVVGYCGGATACNPVGFTSGIAVGKLGDAASWKTSGEAGGPTNALVGGGSLPNRYIGGVAVDPVLRGTETSKRLYLAYNGYSRKWVAGPGVSTIPEAGKGHVFMSSNNGQSWTDVSANLPDVPLNSIKVLANGALVAGSDLGVVYRAPGATDWTRLGSGLPLTVVTDLEVQPNGDLYAATYGRGIWKIAGSAIGASKFDGGWYEPAAAGTAAVAAAPASAGTTAAGASTTGPTSTTATTTTSKATKKKVTKKRARAKARLSRR